MNIIQLVFLLLFVCSSFKCVAANGIGNNTNNIMCVEEDRQALFKFKHAIKIDRCGLLSTWAGDNQNCCHWHGVRCDNNTGRVIKLNLRGTEYHDHYYGCLEGRVSSSVVNLKHLTYLDLSFNNFTYQHIPTFIGSLVNLKYLNLSYSEFEGEIPHQLGNLSSLISLDLTSYGLYVNDLSWLSRLTRLTSLNLSYVDLSRATNWSQIVNNLPFLRILRLDGCDLLSPVIPRPLSFKNSSTTFHFLSLSENNWNDSSIVFEWLFNLSGINTHLAHLDLSDNQLGGPLPSAFGNLHSLSYLDLSNNQLGGPLPSAFGNLHSLSYLDLSDNQLGGPLPSAFGNLHSLTHLDLSVNNLGGPLPSDFGNLHSLSYLDLFYNQFQGNILPSFFGNMHSLTYLNLEDNQLEGPIPDTISNIEPLTHLHLSFNNFQSLPKTLGNLCSLRELWLKNNSLSDELPNIIQSLIGCADKSLLHLNFRDNQIWGSIPDSIEVFSSLRELLLCQNKLNGSISENLGQLSMLETLDLYSNNLKGSLFSIHFSNLSKLRELYLGNNPALTLNVSDDRVPPFQLDIIDLSNCMLGSLFPKWIMSQTNYSYLDLSNAGISGNIPNSFWTSLSSSKLSYLDLSYNMINGTLPDLTKLQFTFSFLDNSAQIDLSFNKLEGVLPSIPENVSSFLVNNNNFSNAMPLLCPKSAKKSLIELDLSNNLLTGPLPDCWMNFPQLQVLHLENNSFSGVIPSSIAYLRQLQVLHLRKNVIFGKIPSSLENLTSLVFLDLGYNSLSGQISPSIGVKLGRVSILSLRNNNFVGEIPSTLCQMSSLQILDLSGNHITGSIPKCIRNFTTMQNSRDYLLPQLFMNSSITIFTPYSDSMVIMWKRKEWSFKNSLGLVKGIDLSQNKLQGQIPSEIFILQGLMLLNLSSNNLSGSITPKVGQLTALEVLDFSNNKLSGEIPTSLAQLNFLEILDLSNNNLSGKIPNIPQLQRFDDISYMGNPKLCGMPLPNCSWDQPPHNNEPTNEVNANHEDDSNATFLIGLYISVVLGFIVGFWGVCGSLVLKRTWRQAFFRFFEDMGDKFHAKVYLKMARLWRRQ